MTTIKKAVMWMYAHGMPEKIVAILFRVLKLKKH